MKIDTRLVGTTAENIFLSLLNQKGIYATAFDTTGLDGIVFDSQYQLFKFGPRPSYVQIKCRGSQEEQFNPQGRSRDVFKRINGFADELSLPHDSLYFVVGFYNFADIRNLSFFGIPISEIQRFQSDTQYRFSMQSCRTASESVDAIFEI